ncbi:MAG: hypothetical protein U0167_15155 [bacterium]
MSRGRSRRFALARASAVTELAVVLLTVLTAGPFCSSSPAASLCPYWNQTHWCDYYPSFDTARGIGFSTDTLPCDAPGSIALAVLVSSSSTDPHVNQGPITDDSLYLWAWSRSSYGYGFRFATTYLSGDIVPSAFVPAPGTSHVYLSWPYLDWDRCTPHGYALVGRFIVQQPVAVKPDTWGRMKALYR